MKSSPFGPVVRGALFAFALASLLNVPASAVSRTVTAPVEGLRDASPRVHALVGGRIVTAPGQVIERGTLVIRDGVIEAVGAGLTPPADARVWDVTGRTLYAGFIESNSTLHLPDTFKPVPPRAPDAPPAATPARAEPPPGARAWNPRVTPERSAALALTADPKSAEKLRGLGFTLANAAPARGMFRGRSALVGTGTASFNASVVRADTAQEMAFEFGSFLERAYPTSLMGAVALVRQTLLDAQWYAATQAAYAAHPGAGLERPETNESLAALGPLVRGEQLVMFELEDELDVARVLRLGEEFKLRVALRGAGTEYRVRDLLAKAEVPVVLALDFPDVPEVEVPDKAVDVPLHELQQWETAPANAARLAGGRRAGGVHQREAEETRGGILAAGAQGRHPRAGRRRGAGRPDHHARRDVRRRSHARHAGAGEGGQCRRRQRRSFQRRRCRHRPGVGGRRTVRTGGLAAAGRAGHVETHVDRAAGPRRARHPRRQAEPAEGEGG